MDFSHSRTRFGAVRDVMEAGGWKNEETLLRSYQQPDAETVKRVVLHPTQRIVGSGM